MNTRTITLPADQWEAILDAVVCHWDEGPPGEGWKSDRLSAASAALSTALAQPELPPADRFRVGDVWRSPRDKKWKVEKLDPVKGAFLRAMHNRYTTQWRNQFATGNNITDAWWRVYPDANY